MGEEIFTERYDPRSNTIVLKILNVKEVEPILTSWYKRYIESMKATSLTTFMNESGRIISCENARLKSEDLRKEFNAYNNSDVTCQIFGRMMNRYISSEDNIYGISKSRTNRCVLYNDIWLDGLPMDVKIKRKDISEMERHKPSNVDLSTDDNKIKRDHESGVTCSLGTLNLSVVQPNTQKNILLQISKPSKVPISHR